MVRPDLQKLTKVDKLYEQADIRERERESFISQLAIDRDRIC